MNRNLSASTVDVQSLPRIHYALSELALMRESFAEMQDELAPRDARRLLLKLELFETVALELLDDVESRTIVVTH